METFNEEKNLIFSYSVVLNFLGKIGNCKYAKKKKNANEELEGL